MRIVRTLDGILLMNRRLKSIPLGQDLRVFDHRFLYGVMEILCRQSGGGNNRQAEKKSKEVYRALK